MGIKFEGDRIRQLRMSLGLSPAKFARTLETSRQLVNQWEAGAQKPQVRMLVRMCNRHNVPIDYFFVQRNVTYTGGEQ